MLGRFFGSAAGGAAARAVMIKLQADDTGVKKAFDNVDARIAKTAAATRAAETATKAASVATAAQTAVMTGGAVAMSTYADRASLVGKASRRAGLLVSAGLTAPIVLLGRQIANMAFQQVEATTLVENSLKDQAQAVKDWAAEQSKALGLNRYWVESNTAMAYVMANSMGFTKEKALETGKAIVMLAADMASFYNMDHNHTYRMITAGLAGEGEMLKRVGILLQENVVSMHAQEAGLGKITAATDAGLKTQARWISLMKQTSFAHGDLARTIDSPVNQMRMLSSRMEEAQVALGTAFLPAIQSLLRLLPKMSGALKTASDFFAGMTASTRDQATAAILVTVALGPLLTLYGGLIGAVTTTVKVIAAKIIKRREEAAATLAAAAAEAAHTAAMVQNNAMLGVSEVMIAKSAQAERARQKALLASQSALVKYNTLGVSHAVAMTAAAEAANKYNGQTRKSIATSKIAARNYAALKTALTGKAQAMTAAVAGTVVFSKAARAGAAASGRFRAGAAAGAAAVGRFAAAARSKAAPAMTTVTKAMGKTTVAAKTGALAFADIAGLFRRTGAAAGRGAKALGPLGKVLRVAGLAAWPLVKGLTVVAGVLGIGLTAPVAAVVLGIGALAASLVRAYKQSDTFRNFVNALGLFLKNKFVETISDVVGWFKSFGAAAGEAADAAGRFIAGIPGADRIGEWMRGATDEMNDYNEQVAATAALRDRVVETFAQEAVASQRLAIMKEQQAERDEILRREKEVAIEREALKAQGMAQEAHDKQSAFDRERTELMDTMNAKLMDGTEQLMAARVRGEQEAVALAADYERARRAGDADEMKRLSVIMNTRVTGLQETQAEIKKMQDDNTEAHKKMQDEVAEIAEAEQKKADEAARATESARAFAASVKEMVAGFKDAGLDTEVRRLEDAWKALHDNGAQPTEDVLRRVDEVIIDLANRGATFSDGLQERLYGIMAASTEMLDPFEMLGAMFTQTGDDLDVFNNRMDELRLAFYGIAPPEVVAQIGAATDELVNFAHVVDGGARAAETQTHMMRQLAAGLLSVGVSSEDAMQRFRESLINSKKLTEDEVDDMTSRFQEILDLTPFQDEVARLEASIAGSNITAAIENLGLKFSGLSEEAALSGKGMRWFAGELQKTGGNIEQIADRVRATLTGMFPEKTEEQIEDLTGQIVDMVSRIEKEMAEGESASAKFQIALASAGSAIGGSVRQALNIVLSMSAATKDTEDGAVKVFSRMQIGIATTGAAMQAVAQEISGIAGVIVSDMGSVAQAFAQGGAKAGIFAAAVTGIKWAVSGVKKLFGMVSEEVKRARGLMKKFGEDIVLNLQDASTKARFEDLTGKGWEKEHASIFVWMQNAATGAGKHIQHATDLWLKYQAAVEDGNEELAGSLLRQAEAWDTVRQVKQELLGLPSDQAVQELQRVQEAWDAMSPDEQAKAMGNYAARMQEAAAAGVELTEAQERIVEQWTGPPPPTAAQARRTESYARSLWDAAAGGEALTDAQRGIIATSEFASEEIVNIQASLHQNRLGQIDHEIRKIEERYQIEFDRIDELIREKQDAANAAVEALGIEKIEEASVSRLRALDLEIRAIEEARDARITAINREIRTIEEARNARLQSIDREIRAIEEARDGRLRTIGLEIRGLEEARDAQLRTIDLEARAIKEALEGTDRKIAALERVMDAERVRHESVMANLAGEEKLAQAVAAQRIAGIEYEAEKLERLAEQQIAGMDELTRRLEDQQTRFDDMQRAAQGLGIESTGDLGPGYRRAELESELDVFAERLRTLTGEGTGVDIAAVMNIPEVQEQLLGADGILHRVQDLGVALPKSMRPAIEALSESMAPIMDELQALTGFEGFGQLRFTQSASEGLEELRVERIRIETELNDQLEANYNARLRAEHEGIAALEAIQARREAEMNRYDSAVTRHNAAMDVLAAERLAAEEKLNALAEERVRIEREFRDRLEPLYEERASLERCFRDKLEPLYEARAALETCFRDKLEPLYDERASLETCFRDKLEPLYDERAGVERCFRDKLEPLYDERDRIERDFQTEIEPLLDERKCLEQSFADEVKPLLDERKCLEGKLNEIAYQRLIAEEERLTKELELLQSITTIATKAESSADRADSAAGRAEAAAQSAAVPPDWYTERPSWFGEGEVEEGRDTYHTGGLVRGRGGRVTDVPILAQAGEFVMRRQAVADIGLAALRALNGGLNAAPPPVRIDPRGAGGSGPSERDDENFAKKVGREVARALQENPPMVDFDQDDLGRAASRASYRALRKRFGASVG